MPRFKILIADDIEDKLDQAQMTLIDGGASAEAKALRLKFANELFDIHRFQIVGQAIDALQHWQPDLGMVDIRFNELKQIAGLVERMGYDPEKEATAVRGIDLLAELRARYPDAFLIAYTGSGLDADVFEPLRAKGIIGAEYFLPLFQKDAELPVLTAKSRDTLGQMFQQFRERIHREQLKTLYENHRGDEAALLEAAVSVEGRTFQLKHLFAHLAALDEHGTLRFAGLTHAIEEVLAAPESSAVGDASGEGMIDGFGPNGYWRHPSQRNNNTLTEAQQAANIHQVILDFRASAQYQRLNRQINLDAANLALRIIEANHQNRPLAPMRNFNIGSAFRRYGETPWTNTFHRALMLRRTLLVLNELLDNHIFSPYPRNADPNKSALTTIFRFANLGEGGYDNEKRILSTLLGLSLQTNYQLLQRLKVHEAALLREEREFIDEYGKKIQARFQPPPNHRIGFNAQPFE